MNIRMPLVAAMSAIALLSANGCAVMRDQQSVGTYIDDSVLTTQVKAKFAEDPIVSAMAISVETWRRPRQKWLVNKTEPRDAFGHVQVAVAGAVGRRWRR